MLPRVLEPEVMDDEAEVAEYDAMPHDDVNARFVEDFLVRFPPGAIATATVLDLGTGTALIPLLLLQREPGLRVTAVDRSAAMLRMAARHACRFGQQERLDLVEADVCRLPFADRSFDMVLSNSLLHHLPEPVRCLREAARVLRPGGMLFLRDLFRPETDADVERLVALHAGRETEAQRQLLRQSLHAALTVPEIEACCRQIAELNLAVATSSDRHWTLAGVRRAE
ncbi:MAG: class I SAM-dependent methyltransferase [Planctomycetaceae bacterium]|nr:class I SAM-dependent methyltransferase [Planctomycetaceae bacterium]